MTDEPGTMREGVPSRVGQLTPEERTALEQRLLAKRRGSVSRSAILRREPSTHVPLSFAQQRMWLLEQMAPGNAAHVIADAFLIEGDLDPSVLRRSFEELVRRHESLRTTFTVVDDEPVQVVAEASSFDLPVEDIGEVPGEHLNERVRRLLAEEVLQSIDLERGPVFRVRLLRTDDDAHLLLILAHHIVSDAWSCDVIMRELALLYDAFARHESSPLAPPPIQYADFAVWQRQRLQGEQLDRQVAYWREKLDGAPTLELPMDRPRPALPDPRGAHEILVLPRRLTGALRTLCRTEEYTVYMVVLAALSLLLHRYSGQDDMMVGSPIANRNRSELDGVIGFFVNMLVLRMDLSGDPTGRELLDRVREVVLAANEHQDVPFEKLVNELHPARDLSRTPFFQVAYEYRRLDTDVPEPTSLRMRPVGVALDVTRFDLEMHGWERGDDIGVQAVYRTDLFDASTIKRMLSHLTVLLDRLVAAPDECISRLELLGPAERRRILVDWNDTDRSFQDDRCIHEWFELHARQAPEAVALVFEDVELTYGALDRRANRLAHELRARGVRPDSLVGICAERGFDMVVGILGILKAGGAYVPLDPAYPAERLGFMLADSGISILLTQKRLEASLPAHDATVLCLDRDVPGEDDEDDHAREAALPCVTDPENLAYAIYTSGSTGTPKAALLRHRGVCNLSEEQARAFGVGPGSRVLQFSSFSFDASTFEIVMALANGATLYLDRRETLLPGPDLLRFLRRHAITIVTLPPSALAALPVEPLPDLKTITVAGEVCPEALVSRWAPGRRFFNLYGPTETTIWSTMAELQATGDAPHIGRPIGNTRIYVLDRRMRPVPVGMPGELYIAGVGLARGYHRRTGLTAERFVPDPFGDLPGARLYRTGDKARYRPDGRIEFLGRMDFQVKVRGFRIEPGEVEATATLHPEVQHAVAVAREDTSGGGRLVLYIVAADPSLSTISLREFMRERLPEYMVPSAVVVLDAFPLTPSGKIDRRALPAPSGDLGSKDVYIAPRSELEERIAAIWRDLLLVESVGVTDNFFDIGGHSLLLVQVHARLQEELGPDIAGALSVTDLFQHPTVSALARRLTDGDAAPLSVGGPRRMIRGRRAGDNAIAVIGMAGRFPGAPDIETLWRNLRSGVESVRFFTDDELSELGTGESILRDPQYVKARAVLDEADRFDARFFGYTPREAEFIDPQQRIFLECAWEGLERAGYDPRRYGGMIGVYAGASMNSYLGNVQSHPELVRAAGGLQLVISNDKDFLATRVSYKLDLRGPSVSVQTACSTSLVAVHEACQALLEQRCDIALAGGVSVSAPLVAGYMYREGSILSPDGHCRAFDANARGTLVGNGAGVVVLKPLEEAVADGDRIHAVIRGTAVNNDGANKVGYTAPSVEGQAEVIALAQSAAGIESDTVTYIEAHGTGTPLGDPIEVAALRKVFEQKTDRKGFCGIGSLKTNMGHLDAAAGVAGLIKTVLALEHRELPPSLHFETPNPEIDFASSPFYVVTDLRPWECDDGRPRRAGVSSFGMGGTNAHAIVEESPLLAVSGPSRDAQLLVLSAKSEPALDNMAANVAAHLTPSVEAAPAPVLADVAYTLQVGRSEFEHRRAISCHTTNEAVAALAGERPEAVWTGHAPAGGRQVAFMFPGQGAQYVNMGLGLYRTEAVFRRTVERCFDTLLREASLDLRSMLYPDGEPEGDATECLMRTAVAQPALFTVQYALARLWQSWGVEPEACIGHSIGEFTSACISGVLEVDDALRLVALRGQLMEQMPEGAMLAVPVAEPRAREILDGADGLWLSAVNGPLVTVVSGGHEAVDALSRRLAAEGLECRLLHTSHAFHSGLMDGAVAPFVEAVRSVRRSAARIPYVSNVTGDWIGAAEIEDPSYWGRHIREPVRFSTGLEKLLAHPERILLEVGPGGVLGTLARQHRSCGRDRVVVPSLGHPKDDTSDELFVTRALGRLWVGGASVDWSSYHAGERRRRVVLPTYPFARERYWIEPRRDGARRDGPGSKSHDIERWLYVPGWKTSISKRRPLVPNAEVEPGSWVLFLDEYGVASSLADRLRDRGDRVITVTRGERFRIQSDQSYVIAPERQDDYIAFVTEMRTHGSVPDGIVHAWGLGGGDREEGAGLREEPDTSGFYSLLYLVQALGASGEFEHLRLKVLCSNLFRVDSGDDVDAARSLLLGPAKVIPLEYPTVSCGLFDIEAPDAEQSPDSELIDALFTELDLRESAVVAFRRGARWCPHYEQVQVDLSRNDYPDRYVGGSYLITGGLTDPGLSFAEHLVSRGAKGLLLVDEDDGRSGRNRNGSATERVDAVEADRSRLEALEQACKLVVATCGWHDSEVLEEVVAEAEGVFGEIRGVIHAAAVDGEGLIQLKPRDAVERVLAPKVSGTLSIERVFHRRPLEFLVLFGSSISATGMFGQVDSCAGSAYLGGFAESEAASSDRLTLAMEWPVWLGPADTNGAQIKDDLMQSVVGQYREAHGVTCEQGVKIFEQALAARLPRIVVARSDLNALVRDSLTFSLSRFAQATSRSGKSLVRHQRPEISEAFVAPGSEIETTIAELWEELFGFKPVGITDDFFELGGNSLLAIQLTARLRETFRTEIPLSVVFEEPTVREMALSISLAEQDEGAELAALLSEIESLSPEEVKAELAAEQGQNDGDGIGH